MRARVQTLDVAFEAGMYYYIAATGHNSAWNTMFYMFSFVKGGLMAVVTLLVGAGWSILKVSATKQQRAVRARLLPPARPLPLTPTAPHTRTPCSPS